MGKRLFNLSLAKEAAKPPTISTTRMGLVITCALLADQPSWLVMVGLGELRETADISAQKKGSVLMYSKIDYVNVEGFVENIHEPDLIVEENLLP